VYEAHRERIVIGGVKRHGRLRGASSQLPVVVVKEADHERLAQDRKAYRG